jgi:predicted RecB family nuclease
MTEIRLGGYAAKQCPRVTHNRFCPEQPEPAPTPPDVQQRLDEGIAFEAQLTQRIAALFEQAGRRADLVIVQDDWDQDTTMRAVEQGVAVIVNARLADSATRKGAPDILVRYGDGYLPVDIKHHQTIRWATGATPSRSSVQLSPITDPTAWQDHRVGSNKGGSHANDAFQLAHYTRHLQDLGLHAGPHVGGIVGTSAVTALVGEDVGITWYKLDEPVKKGDPSVLSTYDQAFACRLAVGRAAADGGELVRPLHIAECAECPWREYCPSVVPADDASFAIVMSLPDRDRWTSLYNQAGHDGRLSVAQLAALDLKEFPDSKWLADLVRRAAMTVAGRDIDALHGVWPKVPAAGLEADFDIEWDRAGRIYQWGLRVRDGQDESTVRNLTVYDFAPMDDAAEERLARRFVTVVESLKREAQESGRKLKIFHWHHVEKSRTRKFDFVERALAEPLYDLLKWFGKYFFTRQSQSIKKVAPLFGFHWAVDDPGGLGSMEYIEKARQGDAAAVEWCLKYNYSDVEAQAWIRDGLRRMRPPEE